MIYDTSYHINLIKENNQADNYIYNNNRAIKLFSLIVIMNWPTSIVKYIYINMYRYSAW